MEDQKHNFAECLRYEKSQQAKADKFYNSKGALEIERMEYDNIRFGRQKQLDDIDCVVKFYNEFQPIPISEKFRREKHDDVLFEIFSDIELKKPGWMRISKARRLYCFMGDHDVYEFDDLEKIKEICEEFINQRTEAELKLIGSKTWKDFNFTYNNKVYILSTLVTDSTGVHGKWKGACLVIPFELMKDLGISYRHYTI